MIIEVLKGRDHGYAHARRLSLQNKFVGSTLNSKSLLLGCLPFDRKIRLGCRKHNGKRFTSLP